MFGTDSTFVLGGNSATISRRAETVRIPVRCETRTCTNSTASLQRHYGFRFCYFSVVDHSRPGDEESREDWSMRYDELGNDVSIGSLGIAENLR